MKANGGGQFCAGDSSIEEEDGYGYGETKVGDEDKKLRLMIYQRFTPPPIA